MRLDDPSLFNTPNVLRCHLEGRCIDLEVALYLEIYPEPPRPAWFEIDGARIDRTIGPGYTFIFRGNGREVSIADPVRRLVSSFRNHCVCRTKKGSPLVLKRCVIVSGSTRRFWSPALTVKLQIVCHYDVEEVGAPRQAVPEGLITLFPELFGHDQWVTATERHIPPTANSTDSLAHLVATAILQAARPVKPRLVRTRSP